MKQTVSERFATVAAAQQCGYCPNYDWQVFDKAKKGKGRKTHKFTNDEDALQFIDQNSKPVAAKKEDGVIYFCI